MKWVLYRFLLWYKTIKCKFLFHFHFRSVWMDLKSANHLRNWKHDVYWHPLIRKPHGKYKKCLWTVHTVRGSEQAGVAPEMNKEYPGWKQYSISRRIKLNYFTYKTSFAFWLGYIRSYHYEFSNLINLTVRNCIIDGSLLKDRQWDFDYEPSEHCVASPLWHGFCN